jgi:hypothetical protein
MKARYFVLAMAAAFSANAFASEDIIGALSQETGLTERQVKMVVGPRSGHAAYLASYDQVQRRFVATVGQERYRELLVQQSARPAAPADARLAQVQAEASAPEG